MVRVLTAALALAALLVPGPDALAGDSELERASLKGLPGVYVLVEGFRESNKRAGFDRNTFQTDVELKLRMAGVKVLSRERALATPGSPWLWVGINVLHDQPGSRAGYSIILQVFQGVFLARDSEQAQAASTWSVNHLGQGDLPFIRDHVKDVVDEFINAWLSVNPKE